jgi:hypothetical protein
MGPGRVIVTLAVLAWSLAPMGNASAQGADSGADLQSAPRVQAALDRTDRRIEMARTLVAGGKDPALIEAADLQAQARALWDKASGSAGERRPESARQAVALSLEARQRADQVIARAQGLPDPERVSSQVDRTREVLENARARMVECTRVRARVLIETANGMQTRAETAVAESRYLAALQLTLGARERALRALQMCSIEDDPNETAERALQRTDLILSRARASIGPGSLPRAQRLLARAESIQEEARRQLHVGNIRASLEQTQVARGQALRLIRRSGGMR